MNNNRLIIGLDFDDVIVDHTQARIKKARELGYSIKSNIISKHHLKSIVKEEDYGIIQKYIYREATLEAPPMKDAIETINELAKNYKLIVISRRDPDLQNFSIKWLKQRGLLKTIPRQFIFFSKDNTGKNTIAKKLGVFIFMDDKIEVLDAMENVPHKILFDQFNSIEYPNFHKIKKWQELPAIVEKLAKNF